MIGENYGVRFKAYQDEYDFYGTSIVRSLDEITSLSRTLLLSGAGGLPEVGERIHIGPIASQSLALRVRGIEAAEDFHARILMVAAAPEIDTEIATVMIGGNDPAMPSALNAGAVMFDGSLGNAFLIISVPAAKAPSQLQIYRAPSGSALDFVSHMLA